MHDDIKKWLDIITTPSDEFIKPFDTIFSRMDPAKGSDSSGFVTFEVKPSEEVEEIRKKIDKVKSRLDEVVCEIVNHYGEIQSSSTIEGAFKLMKEHEDRGTELRRKESSLKKELAELEDTLKKLTYPKLEPIPGGRISKVLSEEEIREMRERTDRIGRKMDSRIMQILADGIISNGQVSQSDIAEAESRMEPEVVDYEEVEDDPQDPPLLPGETK